MISEQDKVSRNLPPGMPWHITIILLVMVFAAALIRPLAPHGFLEFLMRIADQPVSLEIGGGRSVRLIEEPAIKLGCQSEELTWAPDGSAVVVPCDGKLQLRALDGHLIGSVRSEWREERLQVLSNPFRVVYLDKAEHFSVAVMKIWDVERDRTSVVAGPLYGVDNFMADQDQSRAATTGAMAPERQIGLLSLENDSVTWKVNIRTATQTLRWIPAANALLLGSSDGILSRVDATTGEVRELATPYKIEFPAGGGAGAPVEGLVVNPDGNAVAIFKGVGGIYPAPGRNFVDEDAARKWDTDLGTTVEIRSVEDGRLLDRMPGTGPVGTVVSLAWDPLDRFIAVSGHDALYLWDRHTGKQAVMTYKDARIRHALSISRDGRRLALTTATGLRIFRIEAK